MDKIKQMRHFMKANFTDWPEDFETDQNKKLAQPPLEHGVENPDNLIDLPKVDEMSFGAASLSKAMYQRISHRKYEDKALSIDELSYLLFMTQGVKKTVSNGYATKRTVPSGGARHPFETYLVINHVENLTPGIYRYVALEHKLEFLFTREDAKEALSEAVLGQVFVGNSPVTFLWSCVPYRGEWRYHISAHKTMLLDVGHVCQNLYLACEAIGCGTCAIAAYDQDKIDHFLKLDGDNEFVVYLAPVGKV